MPRRNGYGLQRLSSTNEHCNCLANSENRRQGKAVLLEKRYCPARRCAEPILRRLSHAASSLAAGKRKINHEGTKDTKEARRRKIFFVIPSCPWPSSSIFVGSPRSAGQACGARTMRAIWESFLVLFSKKNYFLFYLLQPPRVTPGGCTTG